MRLAALLALLLLGGCILPSAPPAKHGVGFEALRVETEIGFFTAILYCDEAPQTCAFMRTLVEAKYYDGRAFGRVVPGFVIQEVDRTGGTTDQRERVKGEFGTDAMFSAGALGIARDADPDSGGSEFFVMDFATSTLYGNFTAFAQVVEGMDVVHAIARVPAVRTGPASAVGLPAGSPLYAGVHDRVPVDPVAITKVTLIEVELPADQAARYPLRVGETFRAERYRATLEWGAHLKPGCTCTLTWYVFARGDPNATLPQDPPPFNLAGASVRIDGETLALAADPTVEGIGTFVWGPRASGTFAVALVQDGREVATTNVTVA